MQEKEYRYVGKSISNDCTYGKVTGAVEYCSDMHSDTMLHMKLKPSEVAHGRITKIDISEASQISGVRAIYTYQNTPDTLYDRGRVAAYEKMPNQERLFDKHIRFMGERVAAVVADTVEIAEDACQRIQVEYEGLPAALTVQSAMEEDAPLIHEEGNVYEAPIAARGGFEECSADLEYQSDTHIGRITHLSMETHAVRAKFEKAFGKLTIWTGCQTAFGIRSTIGDFLHMPYSKVRVIKTVVGGSFGCKQETIIEPIVAYAAKDLKADVKLVFTREEQIVNAMLKHSLDLHVKSKVNNDGTIEGLSVDAILDAGAYQTISPSYTRTIGGKLGKSYRIPNIRYFGRSVCTNTPVNGSFRSWGSSEVAMALENHWNQVANELGMDPIDFRLKNVLNAYEKEVMHQVTAGNVHFQECLTKGREAFRWDERKEICKKKNEDERYRYGVGMAIGSHTSSFYPYMADIGSAFVRIQDDGSLLVNVAIHDHGCGTVMAMKKIAAEVIDMDIEQIELKEADTDVSLYDYGCYGSRTIYVLGQAVKDCCEKLLHKAKQVAASSLQCMSSVLEYEAGAFYKEDQPDDKVTLKGAAEYALSVMGQDIYESSTINSYENPGVPAAHFTEVKVDTFSGSVEIVKCLSVHDIGKAINPDLCIGQVGSGIQQGIGIALCEDIKIDPNTGKVLVTNFKNYEVANACEMPDYETLFIEEGGEQGPFGSKSIGEVVVVPVAPAIVAAVNEALGSKLTSVPITPSVILDTIERLRRDEH